MNNGATIWARQTIESDIFFWKPDKWFKIWFYIVNRVNHKDKKQFKRGNCFITYKEISENTKSTIGQVDKFIRWARKEQMLATRKSTRGMILTVLKYNHYQTLDNYKVDTEVEIKSRQSRDRVDTINKNDKNVKNDKNIIKSKNISLCKPLVDTLIKEMKLLKPDGDYKFDNLFPAQTLIKLLKEDYIKRKGIELTDDKLCIEFSRLLKAMDDFNYKNATKICYITKNWGQIINKLKTQNKNMLVKQLFDLNVEASVLGLIISDSRKIKDIKLEADDFYKKSHKQIFWVIQKLVELKKGVDIITISNALKDKLEEVGGKSYIASLCNSVVGTENFNEYQKILKELSFKRKEIVRLQKEIEDIDNKTFNIEEDDNIVAIQDIPFKGRTQPMTIDLKPLNDLLEGGYREGELHIISGYAKDGKTTFCEWMTYMFSLKAIPTLWITYEMNINHLQHRFKKSRML